MLPIAHYRTTVNRSCSRVSIRIGLAVAILFASMASVSVASAQSDDDEEPTPRAATIQQPDDPDDEVEPAASDEVSSEVAVALPPADLPTGNFLGLDFALEATLDVDFADAPTEAIVYRLTLPETSLEATEALAAKLEIDGDVEDRGNGTFAVSGDGQLFVTPTLIQYLSPLTPTLADLPSDDDAIQQARDWLREVGLAPADLGEGEVSNRSTEVGRVAVRFFPLEPTPVLAAYPSITVTLGPDGIVLEASVRWATVSAQETYLLRPAEDAWRLVESGEAYLEASLGNNDNVEPGAVIAGTVRYTDISIAYTTAGPPDGEQFLTPVYVFSGRLTTSGDITGSFPISSYVSAIASSDTPVG